MLNARLTVAIASALLIGHDACSADTRTQPDSRHDPNMRPLAAQGHAMRARLTINNRALSATLIDSETTRDFISLLPLTLTMKDLFGREKFAHLPRALAEGGKRVRTYEVGDVIYWSPGPDLAIYYRHDSQSIPSPGIIVLGKLDVGAEMLDVLGAVKATIESTK